MSYKKIENNKITQEDFTMMNLKKEFDLYLSNLAVMTFKLHNLHWNVTGLEFKAIHEFTEAMYDTTFLHFDAVAEHQKIFGVMPDCKLSEYLEKATIKEIDAREYSSLEVLEILQEDVKTLIENAKDIKSKADGLGWAEAVSLMEGQIAYYSKQLWFINSSVK